MGSFPTDLDAKSEQQASHEAQRKCIRDAERSVQHLRQLQIDQKKDEDARREVMRKRLEANQRRGQAEK